MKKILIIITCFISISAVAQRPKPFNGGFRIDSLYGNLESSTDTSGKYVIMMNPTTFKHYKGLRMGAIGGGTTISFPYTTNKYYTGFGTFGSLPDSVKSFIHLSKSVFDQFPTSADTIDVWQTPVAITITSLKAILRGSSSPSVTFNIGFGTNIQSPTAVFTADITCTSITTGCSNSSGFNDATIPAGSFIWIYTNAQSGTVRSIAFTINYTED